MWGKMTKKMGSQVGLMKVPKQNDDYVVVDGMRLLMTLRATAIHYADSCDNERMRVLFSGYSPTEPIKKYLERERERERERLQTYLVHIDPQ